MSRTLKESLPSEWVKYLVVVILSVALWVWVFGLYHRPKDTEKIELFFAGDVRDFAFEKDATDAFDFLKQVEISYENPASGRAFEQKYSVVAYTLSDVVLVPESIANKKPCKGVFVPLSGIGEAYLQEEVAYGVYLSEAAKTRLSKYFVFTEERYVAFAPKSSVNAGKKTDHAIKFIEWLVR